MSNWGYPSDWNVRHPNAYAIIDLEAKVMWAAPLNLVEIGEALERLDRAMVEGRLEEAASWPFVSAVRPGPRDRVPIDPGVRAAVLAEGRCRACGTDRQLEVDHILPWSRGGTNSFENLQALCGNCNRNKGAKTMDEWQGGASGK